MDQRICIKFCYKNGIKCKKVVEMLNIAFGESAMSKTRVYEWYKRFQDGREEVCDDERSGRPSTSTTDENAEKVKELIMNDRQITIRKVADEVGISIGSCHEMFSGAKVETGAVKAKPTKPKAAASKAKVTKAKTKKVSAAKPKKGPAAAAKKAKM